MLLDVYYHILAQMGRKIVKIYYYFINTLYLTLPIQTSTIGKIDLFCRGNNPFYKRKLYIDYFCNQNNIYICSENYLHLTLMKDRLVQLLQSEQLSPSRFADILGVQRSGISHILSGRNKPGFDFIEKIVIKFPDINAEWLITGKGKMYKETPLSPALLSVPEPLTLNEPTPPPAPQPPLPYPSIQKERAISKIVILYTDKSFSEYHPE